jgi:hypothetical protein
MVTPRRGKDDRGCATACLQSIHLRL